MFIRQTTALAFFTLMCASAFAQTLQPTVWATKPDIPGFEKMVNDRLAAAQSAIDQVTSVKGARTIENTLAPYDGAVRNITRPSIWLHWLNRSTRKARFGTTPQKWSARSALFRRHSR